MSLRALLFACCLATTSLVPTAVSFAQSSDQDEESQLLVEEGKRALAAKDYKRAGDLLDRALVSAPRTRAARKSPNAKNASR